MVSNLTHVAYINCKIDKSKVKALHQHRAVYQYNQLDRLFHLTKTVGDVWILAKLLMGKLCVGPIPPLAQ